MAKAPTKASPKKTAVEKAAPKKPAAKAAATKAAPATKRPKAAAKPRTATIRKPKIRFFKDGEPFVPTGPESVTMCPGDCASLTIHTKKGEGPAPSKLVIMM